MHLVGFIIRIFTTKLCTLNYLEIFDLNTSAVLTARSAELQTDGVQCQPIIRFWFRRITSSLLAGLEGGNWKNLGDEINLLSPAKYAHWNESYVSTGSFIFSKFRKLCSDSDAPHQYFASGGKRSVIRQT